jgi:voltage-gated potassium channel
MKQQRLPKTSAHWRQRLHEIIFEADTRAGRSFNILLLIFITISVVIVLLESIRSLRGLYGPVFVGIEWAFTVLFTVEYILRLISVRRPLGYIFSFYGLVDLLAILPTYLSVLFPGGQYLLVIRILRLLRVFRVLKLGEYVNESNYLWAALLASRRKIGVFLFTVLVLVILIGATMYMIEGEPNGFTDIPTSIYWAIVTLTTVGYGDLAPRTTLGKLLASFVMLLGYGILAVPTGIVTAQLVRNAPPVVSTQVCPNCSREGHDFDAVFCKYCGAGLGDTGPR